MRKSKNRRIIFRLKRSKACIHQVDRISCSISSDSLELPLIQCVFLYMYKITCGGIAALSILWNESHQLCRADFLQFTNSFYPSSLSADVRCSACNFLSSSSAVRPLNQTAKWTAWGWSISPSATSQSQLLPSWEFTFALWFSVASVVSSFQPSQVLGCHLCSLFKIVSCTSSLMLTCSLFWHCCNLIGTHLLSSLTWPLAGCSSGHRIFSQKIWLSRVCWRTAAAGTGNHILWHLCF